MLNDGESLGAQIKNWRVNRGFSQMDLAERANTSMRHLSFIENGRAHPSVEMVLRLADELDIPLRSRNALLESAGYAPKYRDTGLSQQEMAQVNKTLEFMLTVTEPYPAMIIDRYWNVINANSAARHCAITFVAEQTYYDPDNLNLVRLVMDPRGWRTNIQNWDEFKSYIISRVRRLILASPDDKEMIKLFEEIEQFVSLEEATEDNINSLPQVVTPLHLKNAESEIRIFTTIATLGSPQDLTLHELQIGTGIPMDEATAKFFQQRK